METKADITPQAPPPAARISGSESVVNLIPALIAARKEMGTITRNKTADVVTSKGKYQYSYADLATVIEATSVPLLDNGLCLLQTTRWDGRDLWLNSTLMHTSGEWLACEYPVFCDYSMPQSIGGAISYARRYSMQAMFDLASEDDDAQSASARDRGQPRQQGRGDDRRQQRHDDRPSRQQASRDEVNREFPAAAESPARETWSRWIGPVVTRANQDWRAEMASEGVDPRYQKEYGDLTMEPREVQFLCSEMIAAGKLTEDEIAKDGNPAARDTVKCRAVVARRFEKHPDRIKQAVLAHIRTKAEKLRSELGMPGADDDEADPQPPGVGGYEGSGPASDTPPPMSRPGATQEAISKS